MTLQYIYSTSISFFECPIQNDNSNKIFIQNLLILGYEFLSST